MATASALCQTLALRADDRIALVFPFTHIGGIGWLIAGLLVGCAQIVVETFDPKSSIEALARNGVTQATAGTVFHQAYLAAQRASAAGRQGMEARDNSRMRARCPKFRFLDGGPNRIRHR